MTALREENPERNTNCHGNHCDGDFYFKWPAGIVKRDGSSSEN